MKCNAKINAISLAILAFTSVPAMAQEQPAEHQVSYNVALTSDYRYRGLSQTDSDPALSGRLQAWRAAQAEGVPEEPQA